ncbi:MAG: phosphoribosylanthranilate isomerase [Candidatus Marinimicrobia bacterium]|nr:phosphoribosylanthranilate isomerase [Candidatus Neomarinimicrobiota bacterium]
MIRVKICGITNTGDALIAAKYGADAIGLIFAESKRKVSIDTAREIISSIPPFVITVAVLMDNSYNFIEKLLKKVPVDILQFHGEETPELCESFNKRYIKRLKITNETSPDDIKEFAKKYNSASMILLDPGTGSGIKFKWEMLKNIEGDYIIAGGLNPENVVELLKIYKPYAVDVSSGVESKPGKKDEKLVKNFIQNVKGYRYE